VTGGNRGIGLALTRSIAQAGGNVAILYRSSSSAPQVAQDLEKEFEGQKFLAVQCDVTDQKRVGEAFEEVVQGFGGESGAGLHGVVAVSHTLIQPAGLWDVM
jgi:sorbose reductase